MKGLTDMAIWVLLAELGGFTAAAVKLGICKSHARREVAALEARLGIDSSKTKPPTCVSKPRVLMLWV